MKHNSSKLLLHQETLHNLINGVSGSIPTDTPTEPFSWCTICIPPDTAEISG